MAKSLRPKRLRRPRVSPLAMQAMLRPGAGAGPAGPPALPPGMPPGAGAMPSMKKGGTVKRTGPHKLHKGEKVVPAKKKKR